MPARQRLSLSLFAGFLIAFSLPPWGWWPLSLVGFALWDYLLNGLSTRERFTTGWGVGLVWLAMGELWMFDLTAAGYFLVFILFGAGYGLVSAAATGDGWRIALLPAGIVLFEWFRWSYPFGGVPLATVPMTQVASPLAQVLPFLGPTGLTALTALTGLAVSRLVQRRFDQATLSIGVVSITLLVSVLAPGASAIDTIDVAVVQGGGPQRTRADRCENQRVFDRHVEATDSIDRSVDLIMWPENVVNPSPDTSLRGACEDLFFMSEALEGVAEVARTHDAVLIPGWFHGDGPQATVNYSTSVGPDGTTLDRYDKVRIVPFGEFVPLRSLIEIFSSEVPGRDVRPGTGPAKLDTPVGRLGISISWEVFFDSRGRSATRDGGEILVNPTNGSSYWLTILQSQQVASSRLRAMENDRWVLQAAPTGFSAIVDPTGKVVDRTGVSEQKVLYATIERREGLTLATRWGSTPMLVIAGLIHTLGIARMARSSTKDSGRAES